ERWEHEIFVESGGAGAIARTFRVHPLNLRRRQESRFGVSFPLRPEQRVFLWHGSWGSPAGFILPLQTYPAPVLQSLPPWLRPGNSRLPSDVLDILLFKRPRFRSTRRHLPRLLRSKLDRHGYLALPYWRTDYRHHLLAPHKGSVTTRACGSQWL